MDTKFSGSAHYVASQDLMETVNIAVALQKPLLIKGEPGTGKTMLAQAVAEALGRKLIIWNVKSTTKAQDGLYVYDVVQRLYDSQFGGQGVDDIKKYIKLGKLGEAFSAEEQVVLLIDEIDKADLEFPNDLLWELDRMEFYIPETKEIVKAKQRPIVIITSNAEKELPDAFLRRCVFHYIEFPDQAQMEAILRVHFEDLDEQLLRQALAAFYWLRELRGIEKKPSTSELVDWIRALAAGGVDPSRIEDTIPYAGVLLKKRQGSAHLAEGEVSHVCRVFYLLRQRGLDVSLNEWMTLLEGMEKGLHHSTLTGFYHLCRAVVVKSETEFDRFDQVFLEFFKDVPYTGELPEELMNWLNHPSDDLRRTVEELRGRASRRRIWKRCCGGWSRS